MAETNFPQQILYTRLQAARLLGTKSIDTVKRLERQGRLTPVRLTGPRSQVFYRHAELVALTEVAEA